MKFLALGSFITASLLSLINIIMGIQLTQSASQDSSVHLAIALSVAVLHLLGSLFMMIFTKKKFEELALISDFSKVSTLQRSRETNIRISLTAVGVSIVSILTGTSSSSDDIPWIHAIIGCTLCAVSFLNWIKWVYYLHQD